LRVRKAFFTILVLLAGVVFAGSSEKFGHKSYPEASPAVLVSVGSYRNTGRSVQMRKPAADAFLRMVESAHAEGVRIVPISGFRPVSYQKSLFDRAVKRYGSEQKAARWVAPPGYSEHATGWTLDLGDHSRRETDIESSFQSTQAFRWLELNAARFGFEMSFPPHNIQGVNHEPWHWRFVGNEEARVTFHPRRPKKL
jgi:D-alanyl-D-alanine carboxypeptidase